MREGIAEGVPAEAEESVQGAEAAASSPAVRRHGPLWKFCFKKYQIQGFLWLIPAAVLLVMFSVIPIVWAVIYSFTDWGFLSTVSFIGFENYGIVFGDSLFWNSLLNVILFTVCGLWLGNVAALALAEMLYNYASEKLASKMRFGFLLICAVPSVVSLLVWSKVIFLPTGGSATGVMNGLLGLFGASGTDWYLSNDPNIVRLAIVFTGFPFMGGTSFLIYYAGLQGINAEVIEASKLDGLGSFMRVFRLDFPYLRGTIKYFLVTGLIGGLQNYNIQVVLELSNEAAMVPGYYIYLTGLSSSFRNDEIDVLGGMGYACAMGMIMFLITLVLTILQNVFFKSKEDEA